MSITKATASRIGVPAPDSQADTLGVAAGASRVNDIDSSVFSDSMGDFTSDFQLSDDDSSQKFTEIKTLPHHQTPNQRICLPASKPISPQIYSHDTQHSSSQLMESHLRIKAEMKTDPSVTSVKRKTKTPLSTSNPTSNRRAERVGGECE